MIEILEMQGDEIVDFLTRLSYGHFACSYNDQPYVVPINYAYSEGQIYIYTTSGLKSHIIKSNPLICLQVEEMLPHGGWRSVVVTGEAEQIFDTQEREKAVDLLRLSNPTLMPARALRWSEEWAQKHVDVVYRIDVVTSTGLFSSKIKIASAAAQPDVCNAQWAMAQMSR